MAGLPILLYHHIFTSDSHAEKYALGAPAFEAQMRYLRDMGLRGVTGGEIASGRYRAHEKCVAITFDDGNASDFDLALPILRGLGLGATFFITTSWVGTEGYMDMARIRGLHEAGMTIGSHGVTHRFLSDLDDRELERELADSRAALEDGIGAGVDSLSLPGGFGSRRVLAAAKRAGYVAVYTSAPGPNRLAGGRRGQMVLRRYVVTQRTSFEAFASMTDGEARLAIGQKGIYCAKGLARKVLGSRLYYSLWSRFFREVG